MTPEAVLAQLLPWLRGRHLHVAAESAAPVLLAAAATAGITVARTGPRNAAAAGARTVARTVARTRRGIIDCPEVAVALRLPPTAGHNADAFRDGLRDLPELWGGQPLLLVWDGPVDAVHGDLLAWTLAAHLLIQAAQTLGAGSPPMFLSTVALVAGSTADRP